MCDIEALPDIVLLTIFLCQPEKSNDWDCWKDHLLYISICRRWRKLLTPHVFRNAYVAYLASQNNPYDAEHEIQNISLSTMVCDTNVDLLRSLGRVSLVRNVKILIESWNHLRMACANIPGLFAFAAEDWKAVVGLEMEVMDAAYNPELYPEGENPAASLTSYLSCAMPNVSRFRYDNHWRLTRSDHLFAYLAYSYSHRLTSLTARFKIPLYMLSPFTNLIHLDIFLDDAAFRSENPVFNPTLLRSLRIHCDRLFSWNVFTANSGCICFENLGVFELEFDEHFQEYVPTDSLPVVMFPKLRSLVVDNCNSANILTSCHFTPKLERICFNSQQISLEQLALRGN